MRFKIFEHKQNNKLRSKPYVQLLLLVSAESTSLWLVAIYNKPLSFIVCAKYSICKTIVVSCNNVQDVNKMINYYYFLYVKQQYIIAKKF
jgi:hypothetical protein